MMKKQKAELVLIPLPNIGHVVSILEFAKLLVDRDDRFYVTVVIMKLPLLQDSAADTHIRSLSGKTARIRFIHLIDFDPITTRHQQPYHLTSTSTSTSTSNSSTSSMFDETYLLCTSIEDQKPLVRNAVKQLIMTTTTQSAESESTTRLAGFVLDMLCTSMMDVANEFGVPCYLFFTAGAAFLGLTFHLQHIHEYDHQGEGHADIVTDLVDSDAELVIPTLINPLPARVLPAVFGEKQGGGSNAFLRCISRFREMKGILVNSFFELESHAISSFLHLHDATSPLPPLYPVGPMLNLKNRDHHEDHHDTNMNIMNWLDDQPPSSVVFLCFGSHGIFPLAQVKEIAQALECSRHRFLWSLRQPPPENRIAMPTEYTNLDQVLPQGFLDRTLGIGMVIGWAPQSLILAHPSIGGFVSHCGWNSILESLWFGVPIITWPIYSEQQFNAFQLVKELGLAIEITIDYKYNNHRLIRAEEIENGIRNLIANDSKVKEKAKEMKEYIRNTLMLM